MNDPNRSLTPAECKKLEDFLYKRLNRTVLAFNKDNEAYEKNGSSSAYAVSQERKHDRNALLECLTSFYLGLDELGGMEEPRIKSYFEWMKKMEDKGHQEYARIEVKHNRGPAEQYAYYQMDAREVNFSQLPKAFLSILELGPKVEETRVVDFKNPEEEKSFKYGMFLLMWNDITSSVDLNKGILKLSFSAVITNTKTGEKKHIDPPGTPTRAAEAVETFDDTTIGISARLKTLGTWEEYIQAFRLADT